MSELNQYKNILINKVAHRNDFMGYYLSRYADKQKQSLNEVQKSLNLNDDNFTKLALCRVKLPVEQHLTESLEKIAAYAQVDLLELNHIVRDVVFPTAGAEAITFQLRRRNWAWAAAIAFLIVSSLSVLLLSDKFNGSSEMLGQPGFAQAFLDLGDDQEVYLGKDEQAASQDGEKIIVPSDTIGSLRYDLIKPDQATLASNARHKLRVPDGGEFKITLSDGTKVWLNAGSTLEYPAKFDGEQRLVSLKGEAFFDVATDSLRPFTVHTQRMDVEVLGTSFNIRAYEEEGEFTTTLVEGKININTKEGDITPLTPGSQYVALLESKDFVVSEVEASDVAAWKNGIFKFEGMELEKILEMVCKWYQIEFRFADPQLKGLKLTGSIDRNEPLEQGLYLIAKTQSVELEFDYQNGIFNISRQ